jgi:hypothetical protein
MTTCSSLYFIMRDHLFIRRCGKCISTENMFPYTEPFKPVVGDIEHEQCRDINMTLDGASACNQAVDNWVTEVAVDLS